MTEPTDAALVDRARAVNLARNALTQYDCVINKNGVRVLAKAVLSMDAALTTPQPTQAQAGAVDDTALIRQMLDAVEMGKKLALTGGVFTPPELALLTAASTAARARLEKAP